MARQKRPDDDLIDFVAELVKAHHGLPPYDSLKAELASGLTRKPPHRAQKVTRKKRANRA